MGLEHCTDQGQSPNDDGFSMARGGDDDERYPDKTTAPVDATAQLGASWGLRSAGELWAKKGW